jgi:tetratricopeptide (TPR) repeat protein
MNPELWLQHAQKASLLEQFKAARTCLNRARDGFVQTQNEVGVMECKILSALLVAQTENLGVARTMFEQLLPLAMPAPVKAWLLLERAITLARTPSVSREQKIAAYQQAFELAPQESVLLGRCHLEHAVTLATLDELAAARTEFVRALPLLDQPGVLRRALLFRTHLELAITLTQLGELTLALRNFEVSQQFLGDTFQTQGIRARHALYFGRALIDQPHAQKQCLAELRQAEAAYQHTGRPLMLANARIYQGHALHTQGDHAGAAQRYRAALEGLAGAPAYQQEFLHNAHYRALLGLLHASVEGGEPRDKCETVNSQLKAHLPSSMTIECAQRDAIWSALLEREGKLSEALALLMPAYIVINLYRYQLSNTHQRQLWHNGEVAPLLTRALHIAATLNLDALVFDLVQDHRIGGVLLLAEERPNPTPLTWATRELSPQITETLDLLSGGHTQLLGPAIPARHHLKRQMTIADFAQEAAARYIEPSLGTWAGRSFDYGSLPCHRSGR